MFDFPCDSFCHKEIVTLLLKGRVNRIHENEITLRFIKTQCHLNGNWPTKYLSEKHNKTAQAQIFALTMQFSGEMILTVSTI